MRIPLIILCFLFIISYANASGNILDYKVSAKDIEIAPFRDVKCKFEQEKIISGANSVIKSGGDFRFILKKGVIFDTQYPVKYLTSYTSKENKYVNDIIIGISKKNFSQIEKNFNLYFRKKGKIWLLCLVPKEETPIALQLKNIMIYGEKDINKIIINTSINGSTTIKFTECSQL